MIKIIQSDKSIFILLILFLLLTNSYYGEHEINAQALNLDGSSGLVGEYNDQKETMIEGALVSEFTSGMINAAGSNISTPYGLVSAGEKSSEILIGEGKNLEPIITVQAGTEVLVYFMEALNESV